MGDDGHKAGGGIDRRDFIGGTLIGTEDTLDKANWSCTN
jgi:hypothetical protein